MGTPSLTLVTTHTATTYSFRAESGHLGWACCTVNDATGELTITSDWGNWSHRWNASPESLGAPTLTAFIGTRGGVDYLARKLQKEGRDAQVFSGEKTAASLRRQLCQRRLRDGREQIEYGLELEDMPDGKVPGWATSMYDERGLPLFSHEYIDAPRLGDPSRRERLPYLTCETARRLWDRIGEVADEFDRTPDLFYDRVLRIDGFTDYVTWEPWEHEEIVQTPQDKALREIVLPALIQACRSHTEIAAAFAGIIEPAAEAVAG